MRTPHRICRAVALLCFAGLAVLFVTAGTSADAESHVDAEHRTVRILAIVADQYGANTYLNLNHFALHGWEVTVAGLTGSIEPCPLYAAGLGCPNITPDFVIAGPVDLSLYEALILMPATKNTPRPYRDVLADPDALEAFARANADGLVIGAQCAGPIVLGPSGALSGRRIVTGERWKTLVENSRGTFAGSSRPPLADGNVVTGVDGLYYSVEYADAVASAIQARAFPPVAGDALRVTPVDLDRTEPVLQGGGILVSALGGPCADGARSICRTQGGTYIAGYTYSYGAGASDALVIRTTDAGDVLWARALGGASRDEANAVVATPDGGCLAVGFTASVGGGDLDLLLARFDDTGTLLWSRTRGDGEAQVGCSVCRAHGSGYVIAGHALGETAITSDVLLLKVDDAGDVIWERTFGGGEPDRASDVIATRDGGYFVVGYSGGDSPDQRGYLVKTDGAGTLRWSQTIGDGQSFDAAAAAVATDEGFLVTGHNDVLQQELMQMTLVGVTPDGAVAWRKEYGRRNHYDYGTDAAALGDGRFVVVGVKNAAKTGQNQAWVQIVDGRGTVEQSFECGEEGAEWLTGVCALPGGGFAAAGHTDSIGAGSFDVLLLRTSPGD